MSTERHPQAGCPPSKKSNVSTTRLDYVQPPLSFKLESQCRISGWTPLQITTRHPDTPRCPLSARVLALYGVYLLLCSLRPKRRNSNVSDTRMREVKGTVLEVEWPEEVVDMVY
jgi:hypothetical protein